jgi:hypothetical protein
MLSRRQVRKPDGSLSECQHCFPVYGGGLEVKGVQGILQVSLVGRDLAVFNSWCQYVPQLLICEA